MSVALDVALLRERGLDRTKRFGITAGPLRLLSAGHEAKRKWASGLIERGRGVQCLGGSAE